jgi:flagellar hook-associated protein 2
MATLQSPGIGSGLDINSLVDKLMTAERTPLEAQITRRESKATLQISALAQLKGALATFKGALDPLKTVAAFSPRTATSGDDAIFTAAATSSAATGTYDIEVVSLASAQQLASGAFLTGPTTAVGTGTLTVSLGATSMNLTIDSTNNTLAGIRDAINGSLTNPGVQATLINETGGSRLILTSSKTGEANTIKVTQAGGDGGLAQLVYDPGVTTNLTQRKGAADAHIRIATFDHKSATNTVSDAIDGVTLNLTDISAGDTVTLSVTNDDATLTDRVKNFVAQYNSLYGTFAKLRSYTPTTRQAGPMLGDALLRGVEDEMRSDLTNPVAGMTGDYTSLASIGITKKADGTLVLDDVKFKKSVDTNRTAVAGIFGSENGIAARLATHIADRLATGAAISSRDQSLQKSLVDIQDSKAALDARMTKLETTYRKQFTALDGLLAQMQTTSSYLSQQLANLPKPNSG